MRGSFLTALALFFSFIALRGPASAELGWTELGFPEKFHGNFVEILEHQGDPYVYSRLVVYNRKSDSPTPGPRLFRLHQGHWEKMPVLDSIRRFFDLGGQLYGMGKSTYLVQGNRSQEVAPGKAHLRSPLAQKGALLAVQGWSRKFSLCRFDGKAWSDLGELIDSGPMQVRIESYKGVTYAICEEANSSVHLRRFDNGQWVKVSELYKSDAKVRSNEGLGTHSNLAVFNGKLVALVQADGFTKLFPDVLGSPTKFITSKSCGPYLVATSASGKILYFTTALMRSMNTGNNPIWVAEFDGKTINLGKPISSNCSLGFEDEEIPIVGFKRIGRTFFLAFFQAVPEDRNSSYIRFFKGVER